MCATIVRLKHFLKVFIRSAALFNLPDARFVSLFKTLLTASLLASIAACGGGGAKSPDGTSGGGGTGGGKTAEPTLSISLLDPVSGAAKTAISSSSPGVVKVVAKKADGSAASNAVITFTTNDTLAKLSPTSGTALTDSNGVASVSISAADVTSAGAATVDATAEIETKSLTSKTAFALGASNVTISSLTIDTNPLSAYGTTAVRVTVLSDGAPVSTPLTVNLSSGCAASDKAQLDTGVTTVSGVATASYRDKGCGSRDTITASVAGISGTASGTVTVNAPNTGSIQFISATPTQISLQGTGGQTSANVKFRVVDEGNSPVSGKSVSFSLSTGIGGVTLSSTSAISDSAGDVTAVVQSGTQTTPVRVLATTANSSGTLISTQSAQLTITTGLPTQTAFSVSATKLNIEGWDFDGENSTINARLADHFSNAPPEGTVVNFDSEGAKVQPTCSTASAGPTAEAGVCSVLFTSQALRPTNGRVSVLAFAVGEEGFTDLNGDGLVDQTSELVDANGKSTVGFGEAFVNFDESVVNPIPPTMPGDPPLDLTETRSSNEPFKDFDSNGIYLAPIAPASAKYKGILCKASSGLCDSSKTLHIRQTMVIVLSGSDPYITSDISPSSAIDLASGPVTVKFRISDLHGNALPVGTTVAFTGTNTEFVFSSGNLTIGNTTACMDGGGSVAVPGGDQLPFVVSNLIASPGLCPSSARDKSVFDYSTQIKRPPSSTGPTGQLKLTVTTPKGKTVTYKYDTTL